MLQVAAQRGGIDAAVVGTIDEWKRKHEAVLAAGRPRCARLAMPGSAGPHGSIGVIDPAAAPESRRA